MPKKANEKPTEEFLKEKEVIFVKDGVKFALSDPIMISAFENQGYKAEE
ncbi:Uncharacterised protein [Streptococcus porcinus]|nr:hypothetical protein [Streptococcus porcinus]VTS32779.1 Uncharacterised protein [Streptococcus porcinus]